VPRWVERVTKGMESTADGDFFVRSGPGTVKLPPDSAREYIRTRFGTAARERAEPSTGPVYGRFITEFE